MSQLCSAFDTRVLDHSEQLQYSKKLGRTGLQCTDAVKYYPWKCDSLMWIEKATQFFKAKRLKGRITF